MMTIVKFYILFEENIFFEEPRNIKKEVTTSIDLTLYASALYIVARNRKSNFCITGP